MNNTSPLDFTKHIARPLQNGKSIPTKFKNICYQCKKPFNKKKCRAKTTPVIFSDNKTGAFICEHCTNRRTTNTASKGTYAPLDITKKRYSLESCVAGNERLDYRVHSKHTNELNKNTST